MGIVLIVFLAVIMLFGWVPYVAVGVALALCGRRRSRMRWFGVGMTVSAVLVYVPIVASMYNTGQ